MTKKIVVFAGHDDDTWETLGAKGTRTNLEKDGVYEEYDTNILIAAGAVKILRSIPGLTVYFPQEHGRDMTLKERVAYANSVGADLMIDIHSNASASRTATGAAAFYWKGSANGKRAADIYADLLKDAGLPLWSSGTYASNNEDGWSGFYMLKYSNMPGILLENFFFTTRSDLENFLLNPTIQRVLMEIVAETTLQYFGLKKPVVKPAANISVKKDYLDYGDRGEEVSALQRYLNQAGYPVEVHGYYNAETRKAVMAFQLARGLKPDGVYGKNSKAEMNKALKEQPEPAKPEVVSESEEAEELELTNRERKELAAIFGKAYDRGVFSSREHEESIRAGTMTANRLLYLQTVIAGAALNGGKRIGK